MVRVNSHIQTVEYIQDSMFAVRNKVKVLYMMELETNCIKESGLRMNNSIKIPWMRMFEKNGFSVFLSFPFFK